MKAPKVSFVNNAFSERDKSTFDVLRLKAIPHCHMYIDERLHDEVEMNVRQWPNFEHKVGEADVKYNIYYDMFKTIHVSVNYNLK